MADLTNMLKQLDVKVITLEGQIEEVSHKLEETQENFNKINYKLEDVEIARCEYSYLCLFGRLREAEHSIKLVEEVLEQLLA